MVVIPIHFLCVPVTYICMYMRISGTLFAIVVAKFIYI